MSVADVCLHPLGKIAARKLRVGGTRCQIVVSNRPGVNRSVSCVNTEQKKIQLSWFLQVNDRRQEAIEGETFFGQSKDWHQLLWKFFHRSGVKSNSGLAVGLQCLLLFHWVSLSDAG